MANDNDQLDVLETTAREWITDADLLALTINAFTAARTVATTREFGDKERFGHDATTFHGKKEIVRNAPRVPEDQRKRALGLLEIARNIAVLGRETDVAQAIVEVGEGKGYMSSQDEGVRFGGGR